MSIQLISVSSDVQFPGDENLFPYVFSHDYLLHVRKVAPTQTWWAKSSDGTILPLMVRQRKMFHIGQLLNHPLNSNSSVSPEQECEFLMDLVRELQRQRICDRLMQPATNCVFQSSPEPSTSCPFGSFRLPLRGRSEDEIFATFHSDYRNKIRAAIRQGAIVRFGRDQLAPFHKLHAATMAQTGMPHEPLETLTALYDVLAARNRVLCGVVYHHEQPLGGVFVPWTLHSGHYTHGGSGEDVHPAGAVRLLHWEVIRQLREADVGYYDFVGARLSNVEGTKLEHIQRFKSRFGTTLVQGLLWKCDIRPWKAWTYDCLVELRRKLPGGSPHGQGDIIDQELLKLNTEVPERQAS